MATQPNKQLVTALGTLRGQKDVTEADIRNLTDTIVSNPYLLAQFNKAAADGTLTRFDCVVSKGAQATYSQGTISLNLSDIAAPPRGTFSPDMYSAASIVFVLGHEIHHANDATLHQAWDRFHKEVTAIATSGAGVHDYTQSLARLLDARRESEGLAEIAGFNAVHAEIRADGKVPTPERLYNYDAIDLGRYMRDPDGDPPDYRLHPGLQTNADGTLMATRHNATIINQHWYHGDDNGRTPDYTHRSMVGPLSIIGDAEQDAARKLRAPGRVVVNFAFFGLDEKELRQAAKDKRIELPAFPIYDSPDDRTPHRLRTVVPLQDTIATGGVGDPGHATFGGASQEALPAAMREPNAAGGVRGGPGLDVLTDAQAAELAGARRRQDGRAELPAANVTAARWRGDVQPHPPSPLLDAALAAVARLDASQGRQPDDASERLARSMAALAASNGFTRIDHVLLNGATPDRRAGQDAFVVQGDLDDVHRRVAMLPMADALDASTPLRLAQALPAADAATADPVRAPSMARA